MHRFKVVTSRPLEQPTDQEEYSGAKQNLPLQFTSLVGRDEDIQHVAEMLLRPEVRLLTLTGPAGVGKTRLSIEVARGLLSQIRDGVYFIPLASIVDPLLVLSALAQVLDLRESTTRPLMRQIQSVLRDREMLLLLDNFEQVVDAAPYIAELLKACPKLKIMITSRTVLRVAGEQVYDVQPLSLPDLRAGTDPRALSQTSSVALFVERACLVRPDFRLTEENAAAVAEICARLDGLPLAIELATARLKLLSLQVLRDRLSSRLSLLTEGRRDLLSHQQTLRKTLDWSYDLLDENDKRLFNRLGIFAGGCTFHAAEAVYGAAAGRAGALGDEDASQGVMDALASLLDKSMVRREEAPLGTPEHEPRFKMLEMVREYALDRLAEQGETDMIRERHARYYLDLAERAAPKLLGADQRLWLELLEQDHDNLRAALAWALERGEGEVALRLAAALWRFWHVHGHVSESRNWLRQILEQTQGMAGGEAVRRSRAQALIGAGWMALVQGDLQQAAPAFEESLAIARELEDRRGIGFALSGVGRTAHLQGDYPGAVALYEEGLAMFRVLGDQSEVGWSLMRLGLLAQEQGQLERASALLQESLATFQNIGYGWGVTWARIYLGNVALEQSDYPHAIELFNESLDSFRDLGDKASMATALTNLGRAALCQGDGLQATALYRDGLSLYQDLGLKLGIAEALELLARSVRDRGGVAQVVRLFSAASHLRHDLGMPPSAGDRARYNQILAQSRLQLGAPAYDAAWSEGQSLPPEQLVIFEDLPLRRQPLPLPKAAAAPRPPEESAGLTAREVEVLRLVATGLTDAQVAERLHLSPRTVNAHLRSIYSKLEVSSRSAATRYAIDHKLI